MVKATRSKKTPSKVLKNGDEDTNVTIKGKRKVGTTGETSPPKQTKLINDGYCVFVGNLNNSETFDEVNSSLENYFMTQSLLVQDIRLAPSRKHAFIDLASEIDVTKALSLDGEMLLGQPVTIAKPKVKTVDYVKKKAKPKRDKKDARCLFLKNVPYEAKRRDIRKIFPKAVKIRFPGKAKNPDRGIAFLEFKNERVACKMRENNQGAKIQDRLLIVDSVRAGSSDKNVNKKTTNKEVPPSTTLFVSNLPFKVKEKDVKKVFKNAGTIVIPNKDGKAIGYAFVEFATVADAQQALTDAKNVRVRKRPVRVEFCKMRQRPEIGEVDSKKLIVWGLGEKTTPEILRSAFEGCLSAKVARNKKTGESRGFGFVEYETEEMCSAAKEAMEDSEINGSKVRMCYARSKVKSAGPGPRRGADGTQRDVQVENEAEEPHH
ncbi:nucleolin-like isoform X2 [Syngnathoides biaculeatus]|uniref:nucleolin-like isoform X2 n=1 Tax=Syngnathoides biaculeatus TaxID=300417 RepID=UPI002ADE1CCE|nr:nucleolin-like isoform X2 [Syngnathoides biaculeatus]XP_061695243.1 nucleolin-like isoform X2 [Syngnathoides biaculeatus]